MILCKYGTLKGADRQMPEEVIEQMARYTFSMEPLAILEETVTDTVLPASANADWAPTVVADKDSEILNMDEDDDDEDRVRKQVQDFLQGGPQYGIHMNPNSGASHDNLQSSGP